MSTDAAAAAALASAEGPGSGGGSQKWDAKTQKVIAVMLFLYNRWLNKTYLLDEIIEFPLCHFLHTETPGDPLTFQPFLAELEQHFSEAEAMMKEEAKEGSPCEMSFDEHKSEVAEALGIQASKKRKVEETQRE